MVIPFERESPYALLVNRTSPPAYIRGHAHATFYTLHFLRHLERLGTPVVNGSSAYALELSKATQLDLLESLGLTTEGVELVRGACAVDAPKTGLRVEGTTPPRHIIEQVERIARASSLDVGGIEYLVDDRDGEHYFYDVNALSNFVADAPNVVGFDPWQPFTDYLEARAGLRRADAA